MFGTGRWRICVVRTMVNRKQVNYFSAFALGLVAIGVFRWSSFTFDQLAGAKELPTILFIVWVSAFGVNLPRVGLNFRRLVLEGRFNPVLHIPIGATAAILIVLQGEILAPFWASLFEVSRDLSRFTDATQTLSGLVLVLIFSWLFAALGEEIAFRGILMRGLTQAFGGGKTSALIVLVVQALVFGLVHAYQGPVGIASASISGIIFGSAVLVSKGNLWSAIFAHGFANSYGFINMWLGSQ